MMPRTGSARAGQLLFALSGALLLGALWFQFVMKLPPCTMCFWQRYAHIAVLLLALPAALGGPRLLASGAVLAMLVSAGLGGFHAGVELHLWAGPGGCTGGLPPGASMADIMNRMLETKLVRCDAVPWSWLGISMAGWNAILSGLGAMAAALLLWKGKA